MRMPAGGVLTNSRQYRALDDYAACTSDPTRSTQCVGSLRKLRGSLGQRVQRYRRCRPSQARHHRRGDRGRCFIDEGEPAGAFFNITAGRAKLFKVLPNGRRQITGFVGPGRFLGIAVSDTYAFSAEAIEPVRYCRFHRGKLRAAGRLPADGKAPAEGRSQ